MVKDKYCIAILSIGSGVGQSVIDSLKLTRLPIRTIGLGNNPFAYGAYDCHVMDYLPSIYSDNYIDELINKCKEYKVDLIIPGLDNEAWILSKNINRLNELGIKVLVSEEELISLTRNKEKMCEKLNDIADIFVKSYSLEESKKLVNLKRINFPLIAKPKDGFASNGIEILLDYKDFKKLTPNHIIQELAIPHNTDPNRCEFIDQINNRINLQVSELSIQIVTDKDGNLIGKMASYNKLKNGVPIEIIPYDNGYVWSEVEKLLPTLKSLGLRGPLNIQGRLTNEGLKVFEMNPRFTGITGLRALMGFNEVESCIISWLDIDLNKSLSINNNKFGIRQTTNKAISLSHNILVKNISKKINGRELKSRKTIFVTGASGYLGQELVKQLLQNDYNVIAFGRDKNKLKRIYNNRLFRIYDMNDFKNSLIDFGHIDIIIHCGFARSYKTNIDIAESLRFTSCLCMEAAINQVSSVINISSQSVYGNNETDFINESSIVKPSTLYAQAKYSSELMMSNIKCISKHSNITSLRLGALSGGQNGLVFTDVLTKIINKVINNENIEIFDPNLILGRLDVRDAAQGIVELLKVDPKRWDETYNFGTSEYYKFCDVIDCILDVSKEYVEYKGEIRTLNEQIVLTKIKSNNFFRVTNWEPQFKLYDIVVSLFEFILRNKGEQFE